MLEHLIRGLPSISWVFLQTLHHQRRELLRRRWADPAQWRWLLAQMTRQDFVTAPTNERWLSGEQLVTEHTQCVDVGAMIYVAIRLDLLGRHVRRRSDRQSRSCRGYCRIRCSFRHAEVGNHRMSS